MRFQTESPFAFRKRSVIIETISIVFPVPEGPQTTMRSGTEGRCSCLDWSEVYSGIPRGGTTTAI